MAEDLGEFKQRLIAHAKIAVARAEKPLGEAATNISLVQPFLLVLGYDATNPDEVAPEHHADFSDKYQNKVDYAVLHHGAPVIAIESKRVGGLLKDDRGQLRSYFNACPSVKLGILTDGLRYEFYADSDKPNMMDDTSFLRLNLAEVAEKGTIEEIVLSGLAAIRSGLFNPENVGAEAKRKLLIDSIVQMLKEYKAEPPDEFVYFFLSKGDAGAKKVTKKLIDANRDVVREAMESFVAQEALARFGYAPKDLVKAPVDRLDAAPAAAAITPPADSVSDDALEPSEAERALFEHVRDRLLFLARSDALFQEVKKLGFRKSKNNFRIYYDRPNNGSLVDFRHAHGGKSVLRLPALDNKEIAMEALASADSDLLKAFTDRVGEAGVKVEAGPVLRSIAGGQPPA